VLADRGREFDGSTTFVHRFTMTFDETLAHRVRAHLAELPGFAERRMFGGLCFLIGGHMTAGIVGSSLMLRVGPDQYPGLLAEPHAREMDFTGRPLKGMIYVDAAGLRTEQELTRWLELAVAFVRSLPPKSAAPKAPKRQGIQKRR
jgi:TfoX/Sxy family transcriptional regulator of competence genes